MTQTIWVHTPVERVAVVVTFCSPCVSGALPPQDKTVPAAVVIFAREDAVGVPPLLVEREINWGPLLKSFANIQAAKVILARFCARLVDPKLTHCVDPLS